MILATIVILIFAILLLWKGKGWLGERNVSRKLSWLPSEEYHVMNDIMLPTSYGTTQIDHIVVSIYGVFVIETKNYKGIISGGQNTEKWTKNVFGNKYDIPNPIRQNKVHVAAVSQVLNKANILCNIHSIIAFSRQANIAANWKDCDIVYYNELRSAIRKYQQEQLTPQEMAKAEDAIVAANITDYQARRAHVHNVRQTIAEREKKINNGICPRCGGHLILRHGKYGNFYGCSNYPKCKFIQKVK